MLINAQSPGKKFPPAPLTSLRTVERECGDFEEKERGFFFR